MKKYALLLSLTLTCFSPSVHATKQPPSGYLASFRNMAITIAVPALTCMGFLARKQIFRGCKMFATSYGPRLQQRASFSSFAKKAPPAGLLASAYSFSFNFPNSQNPDDKDKKRKEWPDTLIKKLVRDFNHMYQTFLDEPALIEDQKKVERAYIISDPAPIKEIEKPKYHNMAKTNDRIEAGYYSDVDKDSTFYADRFIGTKLTEPGIIMAIYYKESKEATLYNITDYTSMMKATAWLTLSEPQSTIASQYKNKDGSPYQDRCVYFIRHQPANETDVNHDALAAVVSCAVFNDPKVKVVHASTHQNAIELRMDATDGAICIKNIKEK